MSRYDDDMPSEESRMRQALENTPEAWRSLNRESDNRRDEAIRRLAAKRSAREAVLALAEKAGLDEDEILALLQATADGQDS